MREPTFFEEKVHLFSSPSLSLSRPHLTFSRTLGTPDEELWQGVTSLPDYKSTFPKWPRQYLNSVVKGITDEGIDLLEVGLVYGHTCGNGRHFTVLIFMCRIC